MTEKGLPHNDSARPTHTPSPTCHCEPVRRLARQSVSPYHVAISYLPPKGERIATSHGFLAMTGRGTASRFPLPRSDFVPATKRRTDCHVASLLAMTGGEETDCHVARLPRNDSGMGYCTPRNDREGFPAMTAENRTPARKPHCPEDGALNFSFNGPTP